MKSPHLLSSVHDLAICTRSDQTSHKEEDFITTSQTVVSQYSAELSHRQDGPRCRPDDSCRSHIRNSASHAISFHAESGSGHLLMMLELISIGHSYAAFSSVSFCRLQSSDQWDSQTVRPTSNFRNFFLNFKNMFS